MKPLIIFITILLLISCKKDSVDPIDPKLDVNGNVKTIIEYGYFAVEKWGEITEGVITAKRTYAYNESGFQTEFILYMDNGQLEAKEITTYNSSNKILESKVSDIDGNVYSSAKYQYDSKGKLINWKTYYDGIMDSDISCVTDANGWVIKETGTAFDKYYHQTYKYDSKGNKIEENSYTDDNVLDWTTKYEYNFSSKLIKESSYQRGVTLNQVISYSYDIKGNITDIIEIFTGSSTHSINYIYDEFDNLDNWAKRRNYKNNKITGITKREITYY